MNVAVKDIPLVVGKYIDTEVAPKAGDVDKFLLYMAYGAMKDSLTGFLDPYATLLETSGVMSPDGTTLDLDRLYDLSKFAMEKTGKVNVRGFYMDKSDVDAIYQIAKGVAK